jgi:hypothetical protein
MINLNILITSIIYYDKFLPVFIRAYISQIRGKQSRWQRPTNTCNLLGPSAWRAEHRSLHQPPTPHARIHPPRAPKTFPFLSQKPI